MDFHQILIKCLPQKKLELIRFFGGIWQQMFPWQHFEDFGVEKLVGVPQPKPIHGFSQNFQDMFIPRGYGAD